MSDDLFLRRAIVFASGALYWIGVFIQARRIRRHIGKSPNLKPRGRKEKLLFRGWFLVIVLWIGQPFLLAYPVLPDWLQPLRCLLEPATLWSGVVLLIAGYAGTLWCYASMGDAWRIGVDQREKNALVTRGPYRFIRHPIYGFQIVMLVGTALLLPTVWSAFALITHGMCARIKAADEEAYLLGVHGDAYRHYLSRTGRFFPNWRSPSSGS